MSNYFKRQMRQFIVFSKNGLGFYIPKYQRNYSWNVDNIKQLLEDIYTGIERKIGCSHD